jgi:predicted RNA methylase
LTINIEDRFTIDLCTAQVLIIFKGEVLDTVLIREERIEKINQESFVRFRPEDPFKAKVSQKANIFIL